MKYAKILQCLFYLLRYKNREEICERGTNKISWKKAKLEVTLELFEKMGDYWPPGAKEEEYKEYQKLLFIQNSLEAFTEEQVDDYSIALGKLFRWLNLAI